MSRTHSYEVSRILTLRSMVVVGGTGLILGISGRVAGALMGILDDGGVDAIRRQVYSRWDRRWSRFLTGTEKVAQRASASTIASSSTHLGCSILMMMFLSHTSCEGEGKEREAKTLIYSCGFCLGVCVYIFGMYLPPVDPLMVCFLRLKMQDYAY